MNKAIWLTFVCTMLMSCANDDGLTDSTKENMAQSYLCEGESALLVVTSDTVNHRVSVVIDDKLRTLPQLSAGEEYLYGNDIYGFWAKKDQAKVYKNKEIILDICHLAG